MFCSFTVIRCVFYVTLHCRIALTAVTAQRSVIGICFTMDPDEYFICLSCGRAAARIVMTLLYVRTEIFGRLFNVSFVGIGW